MKWLLVIAMISSFGAWADESQMDPEGDAHAEGRASDCASCHEKEAVSHPFVEKGTKAVIPQIEGTGVVTPPGGTQPTKAQTEGEGT